MANVLRSASADADRIREDTHSGYAAVLAAYGFAYANGWRTGRLRAADMLDTPQEAAS